MFQQGIKYDYNVCKYGIGDRDTQTVFTAIKYDFIMKGKIGDYDYMTGPLYKPPEKVLLIYNENVSQWNTKEDLSRGDGNGVARTIRYDNPRIKEEFDAGNRNVVSLGIPTGTSVNDTDAQGLQNSTLETVFRGIGTLKQVINKSFENIKKAINEEKFTKVYYSSGEIGPFSLGFGIFKLQPGTIEYLNSKLLNLLYTNSKNISYLHVDGDVIKDSREYLPPNPAPDSGSQEDSGTGTEGKISNPAEELDKIEVVAILEDIDLQKILYIYICNEAGNRIWTRWDPSVSELIKADSIAVSNYNNAMSANKSKEEIEKAKKTKDNTGQKCCKEFF